MCTELLQGARHIAGAQSGFTVAMESSLGGWALHWAPDGCGGAHKGASPLEGREWLSLGLTSRAPASPRLKDTLFGSPAL